MSDCEHFFTIIAKSVWLYLDKMIILANIVKLFYNISQIHFRFEQSNNNVSAYDWQGLLL